MKRIVRIVLVAILGITVAAGWQMVAEADDGCNYDEWLNTCIDTAFCCVIPGSCVNICRVYTEPQPTHCHCVPNT